ncbi:MAG: hypothetical protein AAB474_01860 [Patescibacteria group bacterium]
MKWIRYLFFFTAVSFILHIVWENLQAPLYAGFTSFYDHFSACLAGAIGDVFISLAALLFMILVKRALPLKFNKNDFMVLAGLGLIIAVAIEKNALLAGKWSYSGAMPLIPYLNVGLAPILQMIFLLPLSFYLAQKLSGIKLY